MPAYRYIARPRCRLEPFFARMCFVAPWWSAYTCSLRSNDPELKSSLVEDKHVQSISFFMAAYRYIARPRCILETRFARMCFVAPWWSFYTCSLKSNDPTLESIVVGDTHVQINYFPWEPTGILRGPGVD